jgi:hypothetical protein
LRETTYNTYGVKYKGRADIVIEEYWKIISKEAEQVVGKLTEPSDPLLRHTY